MINILHNLGDIKYSRFSTIPLTDTNLILCHCHDARRNHIPTFSCYRNNSAFSPLHIFSLIGRLPLVWPLRKLRHLRVGWLAGWLYWGFTSLQRYFSHIATLKQEITKLWKFKWRGRESNPGHLAPQAKRLTTRPRLPMRLYFSHIRNIERGTTSESMASILHTSFKTEVNCKSICINIHVINKQ